MILAVWTDPASVAVVVTAVTAAFFGFYGLWRTRAMDAAAKQAVLDAKQAALEKLSGSVNTTEAAQLWKVLTDELKHRDEAIDKLEKTVARQDTKIWDLRYGVKTVERELGHKADVAAVEQLEQKIDKANGEPHA